VQRPTRTLIVAAIVAAVSATAVVGFGSADAVAGAKKAPKWSVGDCYRDADVDADEVDLSSKVPCAKKHAVQVIGGAPLPASFASVPLSALKSTTSAARGALVVLARLTCSPSATARNLYPKAAAALSKLFLQHDVDEWMVPAAGRLGWVLPDEESFSAGATALLCIFEPDPSVTGTSAGDVRKISTDDPLATLRLCYDFLPDNSGADTKRCDKVHDAESLIWLGLPLNGQPDDVTTWSDANWAPFDEVCADFADVVVGATRADLRVRADTDPTTRATNGRRFFNCRVYPESETAAFPAGVTATALGKAKVKFAKT
jgi:hypothetical protein